MSFLVKNDLYTAIKVDELEVLIESSPNGEQDLTDSIDAVVLEIGSYIGHRYNTLLIFPEVAEYATDLEFAEDDIVILIADDWSAAVYTEGDLVSKDGKIWNASGATLITDIPGVAGVWVDAGEAKSFYQSLVGANIELPSEVTAWEPVQDPRNLLLRRMAVDMVLYELYSRINPRQIPDHRIKKHDDAVDYLKRAADPRKNITIEGLELVDHGEQSGVDMTYGSNVKTTHSY